MPYTVIVSPRLLTRRPMQYYAPFAGAAIGEFFRDTGRAAFVIYDDFSKQAVSYREVSLFSAVPPDVKRIPEMYSTCIHASLRELQKS